MRKLAADHDIHDRIAAMTFLQRGAGAGEIATGLLQFDQQPADLHAHLQTVATPLNALGDADLVPGAAALATFNATRR